MKKFIAFAFFTTLIIACGPKKAQETTEPEDNNTVGAEIVEAPAEADGVYFLFPENGATVASPVMVGFGVRGMEVEPAGEVKEGFGHHHIVVDGLFVEEGTIVPSDATHIHYGKGQLEAQIELAPGKHTLTMQFADGVHKSYGEAWSKTIEINVEDPSAK